VAIELLTEGRPIGQLRASSPQAPGLAQTGQLALGLVLLQKGVDRFADQGALAAAAAQGQGLVYEQYSVYKPALHTNGSALRQ
jgi:hypothetical protein